MIYELTIRSPKKTPITHWSTVPFLQKKKAITFQPGLNVLYGPNGSGKSTLINGLAVLMHCKDENWPRVTKSSVQRFNRPMGYANGLVLEHDGSPARYLGIEDEVGMAPEKAVETNSGIVLDGAFMDKPLDRMSAGQATFAKLVRFLRANPKKVRYALTRKTAVSEWKDLFAIATESLKNVTSRPGMPRQPVLLLDEIDRSVDFAKQAAIWKQLRMLATDHQIIIASHSPFALTVPNAHYIEFQEDFLDASRKALSLLVRESGGSGTPSLGATEAA